MSECTEEAKEVNGEKEEEVKEANGEEEREVIGDRVKGVVD